MLEGPLFNGILSLAKSDGIMDEITSLNISPYLLRPIRKLEDVLAQREEERLRKIRPAMLHPPMSPRPVSPSMSPSGRFVVIHGGKS
jgi:hypothetical protein